MINSCGNQIGRNNLKLGYGETIAVPQTIYGDKMNNLPIITKENSNDLYPKRYHGIISVASKILNISTVTFNDIETLKSVIYNHIHNENMSPMQINNKYNLGYVEFSCFIKNCLCIKIKSLKEATKNVAKQLGKEQTDEKKIYYSNCRFKFNFYNEPRVIGFELLKTNTMYDPINNKNGIVRDHMYSRNEGWKNKIDPKIISHPSRSKKSKI